MGSYTPYIATAYGLSGVSLICLIAAVLYQNITLKKNLRTLKRTLDEVSA